jgi:hypothetical protein
VAELLPEERETMFNMTGNNHNEWIVFSDDPYWMRRLDKVATVIRIVGKGKEYRLRAEQVVLRMGKKQLSEEQRVNLSKRFVIPENSL